MVLVTTAGLIPYLTVYFGNNIIVNYPTFQPSKQSIQKRKLCGATQTTGTFSQVSFDAFIAGV